MYKKLEDYIKEIDNPKEDLLEILLAAQGYYGKLDKEIMIYIGVACEMPLEEIKETIEFFPFLIGDTKRVEVCKGLACRIKGADYIEKSILEEDLEVDIIETECRGRCTTAPNVFIDEKHYGDIDYEKLEELKKILSSNMEEDQF